MNIQRPTILLVDDDELNRRMMSLLLSGEGYEFETASNGLEAVEAVQTGKFDFVLMDLQMPQMGGYEATAKIRAWEAETGHKHIPVFALTAMLFEGEKRKCLDAGMDDCLVKPFNTTELFKMIDAHAMGAEKASGQIKEPETKDELKAKFLDVKAALPRFSSDVQRYQEFLAEFVEMLPERFEELEKLFQESDYKALTDNAHNLKGVSASLGAMQLSALALRLERQSLAGDFRPIEATLKDLNSMIVELQETAQDYLLEFID